MYTLVLQDDRELSWEVVGWTGIRHESPQVFVLRQGAVVGSASPEGVTAEYLAGSVGGQAGRLVFGGRFAVVVGVFADTEPKVRLK